LIFHFTSVRQEIWQLPEPFTIARGTATDAVLVVVELSDGVATGRGECCPTSRYGETPASVVEQIGGILRALQSGTPWEQLHDATPAGAARNAIDCALWDLRAKRAGRRIWGLLDTSAPHAVDTVFTISLGAPKAMAEGALRAQHHATLKLKLGGGPDDIARVDAVRRAVPGARLVVDVNEAWDLRQLQDHMPRLADLGVEMIEQPLPSSADPALEQLPRGQRALPICGDESCHTAADLDRCAALYDMVNIKLDKSGGLTEALRMLDGARQRGVEAMVGCMSGTSLGMAPALLVAQRCRYVDLDAPLLLGRDRADPLRYIGGKVGDLSPALWG
jgi:L-Ala-D/L-Glu epimerase